MTQDLHCIAYVSSAKAAMSPPQLEKLLRDARLNNSTRAVTGVLLYAQGNFMQVLEGSRDRVTDTFRRIRHSRLHGGIIELANEAVQFRQFEGWSMAYCGATWENLMQFQAAFQPDASASGGVDLLKQFWSGSRGARHSHIHSQRRTPALRAA